jgi:hypothetical protein
VPDPPAEQEPLMVSHLLAYEAQVVLAPPHWPIPWQLGLLFVPISPRIASVDNV